MALPQPMPPEGQWHWQETSEGGMPPGRRLLHQLRPTHTGHVGHVDSLDSGRIDPAGHLDAGHFNRPPTNNAPVLSFAELLRKMVSIM